MAHKHVAPVGRSAVGNHKRTTTWWQGPTVNIRPALHLRLWLLCRAITYGKHLIISTMRLIIIQCVSGEWAVNTAAIYCPALLMAAAPLPSPKTHICQTRSIYAVAQHKQQKELLKWQTNWLLDSEPLSMGGSPLATTFLQSGGQQVMQTYTGLIKLAPRCQSVLLQENTRIRGANCTKQTHTLSHVDAHTLLRK